MEESFWTEALTERAEALFREGFTGGQAQKEIGAPSRSSVIGKWYRMGLTRSSTEDRLQLAMTRAEYRQSKREATRQAKRAGAPKFNPKVDPETRAALAADAASTDVATVSLIDAEPNQCTWIIGEPVNLGCCGAPKRMGSSYCDRHHAIAYVGTPVRKRDTAAASVPVPKLMPMLAWT